MGSTVADYNGDGHLDIFKTNFSDDTSTLYRNNGDGTFTDATAAAGFGLYTQYLGWGTMFFDMDNDGWPDLILVNGHVYPEVDSQHLGSSYKEPRILYHNNGDGTFSDISASGRRRHHDRRLFARARCRRPVERRQDFGCHQQHERRAQPAGESDSQCESLDRDSYGRHEIEPRRHRRARSREDAVAHSGGRSPQRLRVTISNSDMRVHFGLGSATKIEWVEIRWPSGLTERFASLPVDQIHTLKEGRALFPTPRSRKSSRTIPRLAKDARAPL